MKQLRRHIVVPLMVCLISLFITTPVLAIPSLPSSFYGEVKVDGKKLPDGSVVRALIDGQVYAEGYTQTYQGVSVYVLDIPGDDAATTVVEGGREGEMIHFEAAGASAPQTGTWHSGMNVRLDLTASIGDAVIVTQAIPSPVPTQTPIILAQPSPTDSAPVQPSPTDSVSVQPFVTATASAQSVLVVTSTEQFLSPTAIPSQSSQESVDSGQPLIALRPIVHSTPIPAAPVKIEKNDSVYSTLIVTFAAMVTLMGGLFLFVRKKLSIITKSSRSQQHNTKGGL